MPSVYDSRAGSEREARIREVIQECLRRRDAGETLPDEDVVRAHPGLLPELEQELRIMAVVDSAVRKGMGLAEDEVGADEERPTDATGAFLGESIPGYRFLREVHRGMQGVVYEAVQESTGRCVAVKVRRDGLFGEAGVRDRFVREIEILASLDHPNIVSVIDSGVGRGRFFYVMSFVRGAALNEFAESARLSVEQRLRLFLKIAAAVNAAHLRGVIHRDLKPTNILVDENGEPRLVDFGLARVVAGRVQGAGDESARLTRTGQFVGSLPWTSPEQAAGDASRVDLRTDVYSLGVILFQLISGKLPYEVGTDVAAARLAIEEARIPSVRAFVPGVGKDLDVIIVKALEHEPAARYQSAGELAEDVRRYLEREPVGASPAGRAAMARAFVRRNRVLMGVLGVALAGLVMATGVLAVRVWALSARVAELERGEGNPGGSQ